MADVITDPPPDVTDELMQLQADLDQVVPGQGA
jgi:hypothetical protein